MPDKPTWVAKIPEALQEIEAQPDKTLWFPTDLETLLDIRRRRAQELITEAGPEQVGRSQAVTRANLVLFLKIRGGAELEIAERERRKAFARKLKDLEQSFRETPPLYVEPKPQVARPVAKNGLDGLPPGVTIEPGRITLVCRDGEEALQQLYALAVGIGKSGEDELDRRVRVDALAERKAG